MKRTIFIAFIIFAAIAAFCAWQIFGPVVSAPDQKFFYVRTGESYAEVKRELIDQKIISGTFFFDKIANRVKYDRNVKPGKYAIKAGESLISLIRMLKAGRQTPVRLTITKLRTKEDLASKIGKSFETDSTAVIQFLLSEDSLKKYSLDSNTVMTAVLPNTYEMVWNSSFKKIFEKLMQEQQKFWNEKRTAKAQRKNLTPVQVYTMASIVEEETNKPEDKLLIASVYQNRLGKNMRLEADPTVKYAMRNFGLKRILRGHLNFESPYNTYRNTGLPPGPVCTPSPSTIDAVLDSPETDYLFFVAKPDFRGYSNFAVTYADHLVFAKAYQKALDSVIISKQSSPH